MQSKLTSKKKYKILEYQSKQQNMEIKALIIKLNDMPLLY